MKTNKIKKGLAVTALAVGTVVPTIIIASAPADGCCYWKRGPHHSTQVRYFGALRVIERAHRPYQG